MLNIIFNIILFLLSLTVLVSIHELGHLTMAKLFGVYCNEFSIGFGPKLFQIKPKGVNRKGKKRETTFSVRGLPLGGYVSMAGEGMEELDDYKDLPKERFLTGIARWKRAIIMVAGVTLNAILGLILLIVGYASSPKDDIHALNYTVSNSISYVYYDEANIGGKEVKVTSPCKEAGLTTSTKLKSVEIIYSGELLKKELDSSNKVTYSDYNEELMNKVYTFDINNPNDNVGTYQIFTDDFNALLPKNNDSKKTFVFTTIEGNEIRVETTPYANSRKVVDEVPTYTYAWKLVGISVGQRARTFIEVMNDTFDTYGEYSVLLFKAIGKLFVGQGLNEVGGPVAIVQNQIQVASLGIGYFMLFWGLISINLAIINLLPFPGLDGWHLLIVIIESITRKEVSQKFKSIMSVIGLVLLLGLSVLITVKDVMNLFVLFL